MITSKLTINEEQRIKALRSYEILDTAPETDYDNINKLVAMICDVPISLITVVDEKRNFFKSFLGVSFSEYPRELSFCNHTILGRDIFVIEDLTSDKRFKDHILVSDQKVNFYAGIPLINNDGLALGTICVYDFKPRTLDEHQKEALRILALQVINHFELRKKNIVHKNAELELQRRNEHLNDFAGHVSHDLKSPLANIESLTSLLRNDPDNVFSEESIEFLNYIEESTSVLKDYIDGILMYYKADELLKLNTEDVCLRELTADIDNILIKKTDELVLTKYAIVKNVNKAALSQILINLVDNALKYNDKERSIVEISYSDDLFHHTFSVSDNGIGIPKDKQDYIFKIFKTLQSETGKTSTGIGLSTVKNLVEKLGGTISLKSEYKKGSTFSFTIAK